MKNEIFAISGVSTGGKSTILMDLDKAVSPMGKPLEVMTSYVTRDLRFENEPFRRHLTIEEYAQQTGNGEYLQSITYNNNHYCVRKDDVENALSKGHHVLVDCIAEGIRQFQQHYSVKAVFIFASPKELNQRHLKRGSAMEDRRWRLQNSMQELEEALNSGLFDLFINNTDLARSEKKILFYLD